MSEYSLYLKSPRWKAKAAEARAYARGRCQLCNSGYRTHVHHRVYPSVLGSEPVSDLIVLCRRCHARFHDKLAGERVEVNWEEVLEVYACGLCGKRVLGEAKFLRHLSQEHPEVLSKEESSDRTTDGGGEGDLAGA